MLRCCSGLNVCPVFDQTGIQLDALLKFADLTILIHLVGHARLSWACLHDDAGEPDMFPSQGAPPISSVQYRLMNFLQRHDPLRSIQFDGFLGHAEYHATGFILSHCRASGIKHLL